MEGRATKGAGRAVRDTTVWRQLRDRFQALADKQRKVVREMQKGDLRLRACWAHDTELAPLEPRAILTQKPVTYRWESGTWRIGKGPNEDIRARFEALAIRGGLQLPGRQDTSPRNFWIHSLYLHLERTGSGGFSRATTGIFIEDVCQTSATFCSALEADALVAQHAFPEKGKNPLRERHSEKLVGSNIDQLRKDCGWSLNTLAQKTGIDKKLILNHVNKGARPHPSTLKDYAQAFSKELGRTITASDLEKPLRTAGRS